MASHCGFWGTKMKIPSGREYLNMLATLDAITGGQSEGGLDGLPASTLRMVGTALSALYQAATCHRGCHGGSHVLEALSARMYNLGSAAYVLALRGFYDEALNLTRSIGEVSNLVALSVVDKKAIVDWLSSDKRTRLRKYSPSAVRKALERLDPSLVLANESWYSRFCEMYTHVTPHTKPNMHNDTGQAYAGGVYQAEGLTRALSELGTVLGGVAIIVCGYFGFDDLSDEITRIADAANVEAAAVVR
jgi:hypothetical protein